MKWGAYFSCSTSNQCVMFRWHLKIWLSSLRPNEGRETRKDKRISYDEHPVEEKKTCFVKFPLLSNLCLDLGLCTSVPLHVIHHTILCVNTAGLKVGFLRSSVENISRLFSAQYTDFVCLSVSGDILLHWCWNYVCSTTGRVEYIYIYCRHMSLSSSTFVHLG